MAPLVLVAPGPVQAPTQSRLPGGLLSTLRPPLRPGCCHPLAQSFTARGGNARLLTDRSGANLAASPCWTQFLTELSNLHVYGCLLRLKGFDGKFDQAVGH